MILSIIISYFAATLHHLSSEIFSNKNNNQLVEKIKISSDEEDVLNVGNDGEVGINGGDDGKVETGVCNTTPLLMLPINGTFCLS